MHILIYGAGALGQAIGCMLAAAGHQVDLVIRPRFLAPLQHSGLKVTGIFGAFRAEAGRLGLLTSLKGRSGAAYDMILLTTKTYDTDSAITDIASLSGCYCPVVSMQNGCGNLEKLEERLGRERSLAARVITGFEIEQPGTVQITVSADMVHVGGCVRGVIPAAAKRLAEALTPGEWHAYPVAGTFSLAAARLGWRLEEVTCLGLHAAPFARLRPVMARGARAICLPVDGATGAHRCAASCRPG